MDSIEKVMIFIFGSSIFIIAASIITNFLPGLILAVTTFLLSFVIIMGYQISYYMKRKSILIQQQNL
jgi:hypothetical protein